MDLLEAPAAVPVKGSGGGVGDRSLTVAAPKGLVAAPKGLVGGQRPVGGQLKKKPFGPGSLVDHPRYGRGTVLKREGDGEDAKLTVTFPGHGMKKLVEKFAGLKIES